MDLYKDQVIADLKKWKSRMLRRPSLFSKVSKRLQNRINLWIPEKVHQAITTAIRQLVRGVLFGASYTVEEPVRYNSFEELEAAVRDRIKFYRTTAAIEGGVSGAGGILLGLADFPILLTLKIKLLFDIAAMYGYDITDYKERLYLLYIFQLTYSGDAFRKKVFLEMQNWTEKSSELPVDINEFDWRNFQQEYRDYIDIAKMAQLIPVIGAPVGAIANYKLVEKLGRTAMNAYRMRLFK